jgi:hypothetical protein
MAEQSTYVDWDFNNNEILNVKNPSTGTSGANKNYVDKAAQNNPSTYAVATGTDTYVLALTPALTAYAAGQSFIVGFPNANTGASTINIDGLGAKSIVKQGATALVSGDILAGQIFILTYDGTNFQLIGVNSTGGGGGGMAIGGTVTGGTNGSALFIGSGQLQQDNTNYYWDNTNKRLGIGTNAPTAGVDIKASTAAEASYRIRTGTTPTLPNSGDLWFNGTNIFMQNGVGTRQVGIVLTGSQNINTWTSTPAQSSQERTITVTGANPADVVSVGIPGGGSPAAGTMYFAYVSAGNTVTIRFCNFGAVAATALTGTYKVSVHKNI